MTPAGALPTIRWVGDVDGHVELLDQTRLPGSEEILTVRDVPAMIDAMRRLVVRGAPAIGVSAAYGLVLGLSDAATPTEEAAFRTRVQNVAQELASARPTAVNLSWALDRMLFQLKSAQGSVQELREFLLQEAKAIHAEDAEICERLGSHGADLIRPGDRLLTHCNTGALATGGRGTALAAMFVAKDRGLDFEVWVDETRPLLQGARLTTWELGRADIPHTLICDNTAASLMAAGRVDRVFVGADRIAANGDAANKIGTYGVAVLARAHDVPFYVVAPCSTIDPLLSSGADIPIEERDPAEVTAPFGHPTAPVGASAYAPAFDVTPASLITGLVTEVGLIPPAEAGATALAARRA